MRSHRDYHDAFVFSNHPIDDVKPMSETTLRRKNDSVEKAKLAVGAIESVRKDGWCNGVILQSHSDKHDAFLFLNYPIVT